jgi:hypothetical protein
MERCNSVSKYCFQLRKRVPEGDPANRVNGSVFHENLTASQLFNYFLYFMEPEISLPSLLELTTRPCRGQHESSVRPPVPFL